MPQTTIAMGRRKRIALVAHDHKKQDMLDWARFNRALLAKHDICATGTTGRILASELGMTVTRYQSGPLGGDMQVGSRIADGEVDILIFFWDPLEPQPHDPDVKALLRVAVLWNIPIACNRSSADYLISSPLMDGTYDRIVTDFAEYLGRETGATGR